MSEDRIPTWQIVTEAFLVLVLSAAMTYLILANVDVRGMFD